MPPEPHPAHPVRCGATIWLNCTLHQDEAASALQKTLSPLFQRGFLRATYDELHNLRVQFEIFRLGSILKKTASPRRVVKGLFDQISCSHIFPFRVVTSVWRFCFFSCVA